jgi:hypothetical protein
MQSSRIVSLASAPAGCAVPYSTTRDHCGALRTLSRYISNLALNIPPALPGLRHSKDCAHPFLPHRLRVGFVGNCDHLRRPRSAFGRSDPTLPLGKPPAPLRVHRSSRDRAHRRGLTRPQRQFVSRDDEFQAARANADKQGIGDCAAQMFLNRIAQRTRAEARMKSALHQE